MAPMLPRLRVLVADDALPIETVADVLADRVRIVSTVLLASGSKYYPNATARAWVRTASPDRYDAVVIGNNLGAGVAYARELPLSLAGRTIVVFNGYMPSMAAPYLDTPVNRFGDRYDQEGDCLAVFLLERAGLTSPAA